MDKDFLTIVEVGPRDGLQYEKITLPPNVIVQFINLLSKTGLSRIESGSFVSPKAIPQMANTAQVMQEIQRHESIQYPVLVPNEKGMQKAIEVGVKDIAVFTAASNTFLEHNINCNIEQSLERFAPVMQLAQQHGIRVRGYISCTMGCPYEGAVSLEQVAMVAKHLQVAGCCEISLADTTGVGLPEAVPELIAAVTTNGISVREIAVHFHDTPKRNAIAKIRHALETGVRIVDSAMGNLGGCPYAPGAAGNVATELVDEVFRAEGFTTGIERGALLEARTFIFEQLGREPGT